jgi:cytochrome c556
MDPREFTYLKEAEIIKNEVIQLEREMKKCQEEFDHLLITEKGNQPYDIALLTDKMNNISEKIRIKDSEITRLYLMLSN